MSNEPTFIKGIGPPLEQLEEDYKELVDSTCGGMAQDILALITEVKRLKREGLCGSGLYVD